MPGLTQHKPKVAPYLHSKNTGTKPCPQQAKKLEKMTRLKANMTQQQQKGSCNTHRTPLKCQILVNMGYCTVGHYRTSSS